MKTLQFLHKELTEKLPSWSFHSWQVGQIACQFGGYLQLDKQQQETLLWGGYLHDYGKLALSPELLEKTGALTEDERKQLQSHATIGYDLLVYEGLNKSILDIILLHHERWNGKGYPYGLEKESIPFLAQIIGIVDSYCAMTEQRAYNHPKTKEEALAILQKERNVGFSPLLVDSFVVFVRSKRKKEVI